MATTDRIRYAMLGCYVAVVAASIVGWIVGRDPEMLVPIMVTAASGLGIGEISAIGKRATFKHPPLREEGD